MTPKIFSINIKIHVLDNGKETILCYKEKWRNNVLD